MSETVHFSSGAYGNMAIHVDGLAAFMQFCETADPRIERAIDKALGDVGARVVSRARAYASSMADDGTFAGSMKIVKRAHGIALRSTDKAAGVKEFARHGARTRSSKGTPRAEARLKRRSGVGVPCRANAPRAMIPAVNDNVDYAKRTVDSALAAALESAQNG